MVATTAFSARSGLSISRGIRWSVSRGIGGQFAPESGGQYQRILQRLSRPEKTLHNFTIILKSVDMDFC
jgi:hypothetical protein